MSDESSDRDDVPYTPEDVVDATPYSRRQLMGVLAAGGLATVAGCSGGDQPTETPTETARPTTTTGRGGTPGGGGDTPAETAGTTTTSGDGTDTTATSAPTPTETPVQMTDIYGIQGQDVQIEQAQMNLWNSKTGWAPQWHTNPDLMDGTDYGEYLGMLAQKFEFKNGGKGATVGPFNAGFEYHDGKPFKGQYFVDHQRLRETFLQVANQTYDRSIFFYENLGLTDDDGPGGTGKALTFDFTGSGNPTLTFIRTMRENQMANDFVTNPVLHKQFVQRNREATSASEKQQIIQDLLSYEIPIGKGLDHMGIEPGKLKSLTKSMAVVEYREPYATKSFPWGFNQQNNPRVSWWYEEAWGDHPIMAGWISIPFIEDAEDVARNVVLNAALAGKIDTIEDIRNPSIIEQFPPGWRIIPGTPEEAGAACFSPGGKFGAKTERARKLRQAVAYLLDPGEYSKIAKLPTPSHKVSGIPYPGMETSWLGPPSQYGNTYTNYGDPAIGWVQKEKAFSLLREAGLEQDSNGRWVDSQSGDPFEIRFVYYSGSAELSGAAHGENMVEQLQSHGLLVDQNNVSGGRMQTLIGSEDGRKQWDLALLAGQANQEPHPYFGFRQDCGLGSKSLTEGTDFGPGDFRNGYARVKVPMPVGEPDGDLKEVNYDRMVRQLIQVTDPEKEKELVRKICWTINQWVPMVFMSQAPDPNAINMNKYSSRLPLDHFAWTFNTTELIMLGALDVDREYIPKNTPQPGTQIDI